MAVFRIRTIHVCGRSSFIKLFQKGKLRSVLTKYFQHHVQTFKQTTTALNTGSSDQLYEGSPVCDLIRSSSVSRSFNLHLEPLGAYLIAIHRLYCNACRPDVVVANKSKALRKPRVAIHVNLKHKGAHTHITQSRQQNTTNHMGDIHLGREDRRKAVRRPMYIKTPYLGAYYVTIHGECRE
jgi:hypothetical protein